MRTHRTLVAAPAFVAGAAAVVFAVLGWRVPVAHGRLAASASVSVPLTGELGITPLEPMVVNGLRPGRRPGRPQGVFTLRNQTGVRQRFVVQTHTPAGDLNSLLHVEVTADAGIPVLDGTPDVLRRASKVMYLQAGQARRLAIRVWIPASVKKGYVGRASDVTLKIVSRPRGAGA